MNFALPRGGAISGRIVDDLGEPIASVGGVSAALRLHGRFHAAWFQRGAQGGHDRTDDLGQFRLYGLPPGEYYVSATLRNYGFMRPYAARREGNATDTRSTYFPGTTSSGEAHRVTVRAGQDVTNVSFALVSARLGRISGRVTTSCGEPYADAMLMVAPRNDEATTFWFSWNGAQIRGDGTFQTGGLPPVTTP